MHFLKKFFGGDSNKKHDAEEMKKDEAHEPSDKKDEHDKEHNGENKKSKNVCEFC